MTKQKIGRDVTNKKVSAILSSPKDTEDFERWQEEQLEKAEEREEKPKKQAEIKSKMPEEKEPGSEQLATERAEFYGDMARLKAKGKLKVAKEEE